MQTGLGRKVGIGANADVYEYGSGKIIKLFKSRAHAGGIHREFQQTMAVWENGLPVPRPYEIVEINGLPGLVQEYIEGQTLAEKLMYGEYEIVMRVLARLQFQLHSVPVERLNMKDCYFVKDKLSWQIRNAPRLSDEEKHAVADRLMELPDGNCLCHSDLHMLNVIMRGEEPVIIDWQDASIGHPAYDVTQLLNLARYAVIPGGMLPQDAVDSFYRNRVNMESIFLDEYLALSGMKVEDIEPWRIPCAAARLNADICEEECQNLLTAIREAIATG